MLGSSKACAAPNTARVAVSGKQMEPGRLPPGLMGSFHSCLLACVGHICPRTLRHQRIHWAEGAGHGLLQRQSDCSALSFLSGRLRSADKNLLRLPAEDRSLDKTYCPPPCIFLRQERLPHPRERKRAGRPFKRGGLLIHAYFENAPDSTLYRLCTSSGDMPKYVVLFL